METPFNDKEFDTEEAVRQAMSIMEKNMKAPVTAEEIEQSKSLMGKVKPIQREPSTDDIIKILKSGGYSFRINDMDDTLEVNGERITDIKRSEIRSYLCDRGMSRFLIRAEDAWITEASNNRYHPVREYLDKLEWDGGKYIESMCDCFTDAPHIDSKGKSHRLFPIYLRKWMIGAVRRAYTGEQNSVLTLVSEQGIGKSYFVEWLCPIPNFHMASGINPDNKDDHIFAISRFVWEVGELGSTTRKRDIDDLKSFLTRSHFDVRLPYGHYPIKKPALANFIGTANPDAGAGVLNDTTGNRRFWAVTILTIDHTYTEYDKNQLWAEAVAAYKAGESADLTDEEKGWLKEHNTKFETEDALEGYIRECYDIITENETVGIKIIPDDVPFVSTTSVLQTLQNKGVRESNTRSLQMHVSRTLEKMGIKKGKKNDVRGYYGLEIKEDDNE